MSRDQKAHGDPNPERGKGAEGKQGDAEFLTDMFDYSPTQASKQIAENADQAEKLKKQVEAHEREKDPLADVPSPTSPDRVADEKPREHMHKEVLHHKRDL